uniref:Uncharacterized protein n=1 Tax=Micrurus lemniscatus lemniscatus TaxID=129467 RepID=A0A2D4HGY6_MICLE
MKYPRQHGKSKETNIHLCFENSKPISKQVHYFQNKDACTTFHVLAQLIYSTVSKFIALIVQQFLGMTKMSKGTIIPFSEPNFTQISNPCVYSLVVIASILLLITYSLKI